MASIATQMTCCSSKQPPGDPKTSLLPAIRRYPGSCPWMLGPPFYNATLTNGMQPFFVGVWPRASA